MIREAEMTNKEIGEVQRLIGVGVSRGHLLPRTDQEIQNLIEKKHLYVADHVMRLIGCAALEVYSPRLAEIRSVAVLPSFRRTKLGTLLVERCVEEAKRLGVQELLAVTDQLKFFVSLGFRRQLRGQYPLFLKLKE